MRDSLIDKIYIACNNYTIASKIHMPNVVYIPRNWLDSEILFNDANQCWKVKDDHLLLNDNIHVYPSNDLETIMVTYMEKPYNELLKTKLDDAIMNIKTYKAWQLDKKLLKDACSDDELYNHYCIYVKNAITTIEDHVGIRKIQNIEQEYNIIIDKISEAITLFGSYQICIAINYPENIIKLTKEGFDVSETISSKHIFIDYVQIKTYNINWGKN
jgi:hypothetical protein